MVRPKLVAVVAVAVAVAVMVAVVVAATTANVGATVVGRVVLHACVGEWACSLSLGSHNATDDSLLNQNTESRARS